ncbi:MAG: divergent polysaccharide deacetylase family protein [Spirochaetaceae bacterium]|jgi:polysaccharide deacetylase 2 family uncharacterized protein YibQ|nr:divergent polysaccharide deacetylase family protein [Spirochaetaceae bacterium]
MNRAYKIHLFFGAGVCVFLAAMVFTGLFLLVPPERDAGGEPDRGADAQDAAPVPPAPRPQPPGPDPVLPDPAPLSLSIPEETALPPAPAPAPTEAPPYHEETALPPDEPVPALPASRAPAPPEDGKTLCFVIDDAGNNLVELEPFLRFPGPLTIAVLPALPYSAEAARRIREAGKEVILHQPMEAVGGQNPGPGAVYADMTPAEIRAVVERNLAEVGPVAGMNNHQGSKITALPAAMAVVLAVCSERGIYFLDSRTTAETAAPETARRMGIVIAERDVFLDNLRERDAIIRSVRRGLVKADQKGSAVMIGHTWSSELAGILTELYPVLTGQGYGFSTIGVERGRTGSGM